MLPAYLNLLFFSYLSPSVVCGLLSCLPWLPAHRILSLCCLIQLHQTAHPTHPPPPPTPTLLLPPLCFPTRLCWCAVLWPHRCLIYTRCVPPHAFAPYIFAASLRATFCTLERLRQHLLSLSLSSIISSLLLLPNLLHTTLIASSLHSFAPRASTPSMVRCFSVCCAVMVGRRWVSGNNMAHFLPGRGRHAVLCGTFDRQKVKEHNNNNYTYKYGGGLFKTKRTRKRDGSVLPRAYLYLHAVRINFMSAYARFALAWDILRQRGVVCL